MKSEPAKPQPVLVFCGCPGRVSRVLDPAKPCLTCNQPYSIVLRK